jgi:hypothetical protein
LTMARLARGRAQHSLSYQGFLSGATASRTRRWASAWRQRRRLPTTRCTSGPTGIRTPSPNGHERGWRLTDPATTTVRHYTTTSGPLVNFGGKANRFPA